MFTHLTLTNFTVFEHLEMEFSNGINILIGVNGTGKTHILKLLYCLQASGTRDPSILTEKLPSVFRTNNDDINRLIRRGIEQPEATIAAVWDGFLLAATWNNTTNVRMLEFSVAEERGLFTYIPGIIPGTLSETGIPLIADKLGSPAYIPVKEMLSFASGFMSLYDKYVLSFDEIYYDILKLAYLPPIKNLDPAFKDILMQIQGIIGGEVVVEGEAFYLHQNNTSLEFALVSEGFRKLALVWQLVRNGSLCKETTLYWDEPEANLNPSLMQHVAKILLMLAEQGVQIFLATHDYAFLKELDYQKEQTPVTYFALDDSGKNGVQVNACSEYIQISPNRIADENQRLYDLEIRKSLAGNPR